MWNRAKIRIHGGKTKIWNRAGIRPPICDEFERRARAIDPSAIVWRGSEVPCHQQGLKVLGTHWVILSLSYCLAEFLRSMICSLAHSVALCGSANFLLRVVSPDLVEHFAHNHDHQRKECLVRILDVELNQCEACMKASASLPSSVGLRSAVRTRVPAHWSSEADCLPMVHARHPDVAMQMVAARRLVGVRRLPLHLTVRSCRCGLPLDEFGHHRAACAQAGVLSKRGWALENVVARICREAGGRVSTNVFMRDLNKGQPDVVDGRRLEVIVDGLPLHSGAQLAVDTTLCALHRDGTPVGRAAQQDGVVLQSPRPELLGGRAPFQAGCPRCGSRRQVV